MPEQDDFANLVSGAGHIVGSAEEQAREVLGSERYDELLAVGRMETNLALEQSVATVLLTRSMANWATAKVLTLLSLPVFGLAWSIWYWVR